MKIKENLSVTRKAAFKIFIALIKKMHSQYRKDQTRKALEAELRLPGFLYYCIETEESKSLTSSLSRLLSETVLLSSLYSVHCSRYS